jgi:hypothetical protein
MPTTDCETHVALPDPQGFDCQVEVSRRRSRGTSRPLKGLFFGFAATVTIALALASWYVGARIVSADDVSMAGSGRVGAVAETVASPQPSQQLAEDAIAEAYWYTVPPPEFYLQVAALGKRQDAAFVRSLRGRGFRAEVRGSQGEDGRILIGPFSTHAEMERAQSKLESWGVLAIEAEHY